MSRWDVNWLGMKIEIRDDNGQVQLTLTAGASCETAHLQVRGSDVAAIVDIDHLAAAVKAMAGLKKSGDRRRERLALMQIAYGPEGPTKAPPQDS